MPDNPFITASGQAIRCPRCPVEAPFIDWVKHLWLEHHLLFDGRGPRDPWDLIKDWIAEYQRHPQPELLDRCREISRRVDPARGLVRLQYLFLANGIEVLGARNDLLTDAAAAGGTLCPNCLTVVPAPEKLALRPLYVSGGQVSANGYRVAVSDLGLFSRLEIETPEGSVYRGSEPDRLLTLKGATVFLVGPPTLLALGLDFLLGLNHLPPLIPVLFLLAVAGVVYFQVRKHWRASVTEPNRAVDYAWTLLIPRLNAKGYSAQDAHFLAGLALTSAAGWGTSALRKPILQQALNTTEKAVAVGLGFPHSLAALWRLTVEDSWRGGIDPVPLVLSQVSRCFGGKQPLTYADHLLGEWESDIWTRTNLARLRVLLCDAAFETGFEVRDLLLAGRLAPALGDVLAIDDPNALAQLRLLWSLRPTRPWDRLGKTVTAFDLATKPPEESKILALYPDLLLESRECPDLALSSRGLVYQERLFANPLQSIEVRYKRRHFRVGYELLVDEECFWFGEDDEPPVEQLERWFRYYFKDFQPLTAAVYDWQAPTMTGKLLDPDTVQCPGCRRAMLARPGELGVLVDDLATGTRS